MGSPYQIALSAPALLGREREYLADALDQNQLSGGEYVTRFEEAFAAYLGVPHAIATSSGTTALHLALAAMQSARPEITQIAISPFNYIAPVNAIRYVWAQPVFGDVDPRTWGWDLIGNRWGDALVQVHLYGVPAQMPPTLPVIEDAAEALGARLAHGRYAGTAGLMGVFSFYGNKILTTGEGGMIVTHSAPLAAHLRLLRGQGQDPTRRYWHPIVGYNYRLTNLQAALGLGQLEQLDEHLARRSRLWTRYAENLAGVVEWQETAPGTTRSPWLFVCALPKAMAYTRVVGMLNAAGIESRSGFLCVHQMPPYLSGDGRAYPIAEDLSRRTICLPLHANLGLAEVDRVCAVVREALR